MCVSSKLTFNILLFLTKFQNYAGMEPFYMYFYKIKHAFMKKELQKQTKNKRN